MSTRIAVALLGAAVLASLPAAVAAHCQDDPPAHAAAAGVKPAASALPPLPNGPATVMGGIIRNFDPVRDQFKLEVFGGGRPVKMLFDARTQVYRDGKRVPVQELRGGEHASVETTLDGDNIYALRVHMLSHAPEGQVQGQVLEFDPGRSVVTVRTALSSEPVKLYVPPGTPVARRGQAQFAGRGGTAGLESGDLITAKFTPGGDGRGVTKEISILATPGSEFIFSGTIIVLDMHSGDLVLTDPKDKSTYRMHFNPLLFTALDLHEGEAVRVEAKFDGSRYVAHSIRPL